MIGAIRILVIDDDPASLATTCALLTPEGYELRTEPSGTAALRWLDERSADVVICDLMMPELDGYGVTRALKAHPEWRYVPVILLTALGEREALVPGLDAGADHFLSKPVDGASLRACVRSMLRVRAQYAALRSEAVTDKRAALVARSGLTERERQVLDLLLLGRTHEDISIVLGISERTSKFHQANLLAKLGAESRHDLLRLLL